MERGPLDGSLTITTDFATLCDSLVGDKEALPGGLCHQNCTGHHVPAAVRFHGDTCPHALYVHLPAVPCTRQRFEPRVGTIAHRTLRTCHQKICRFSSWFALWQTTSSCVQLQSDHRLLLLCLSQKLSILTEAVDSVMTPSLRPIPSLPYASPQEPYLSLSDPCPLTLT